MDDRCQNKPKEIVVRRRRRSSPARRAILLFLTRSTTSETPLCSHRGQVLTLFYRRRSAVILVEDSYRVTETLQFAFLNSQQLYFYGGQPL